MSEFIATYGWQVLVAVAGVAAVWFLLPANSANKALALKISTWSTENGIPYLPDLLHAYMTTGAVGVVGYITHFAKAIDNKSADDALKRFLDFQLTKRLNDLNQRDEVFSRIEQVLQITIPRPTVTQAGSRVALAPVATS